MAPILGYWNIRGLAQPIRFLLEYTNTPYEEKVFVLGPAPELDATPWTDVKFKLGLEFPNLPYFIDGDFSLTESEAILRHIARKNNLAGDTDREKARVDMAVGILNEITAAIVLLWMDYDRIYEKKKGPFVANSSKSCEKLSNLVGTGNFILGDKISFVDFLLYEVAHRYEDYIPDCFAAFPNVKAFQKRIEDLPAIKKYMGSPAFLKIKDTIYGENGHF